MSPALGESLQQGVDDPSGGIRRGSNVQVIRLAAGLEPDPGMKFLRAFISMQNRDKRMAQALDHG